LRFRPTEKRGLKSNGSGTRESENPHKYICTEENPYNENYATIFVKENKYDGNITTLGVFINEFLCTCRRA
jgi:hypothetical protein